MKIADFQSLPILQASIFCVVSCDIEYFINKHIVQKVALLGTFPPRRCGIATFTSDLYSALVHGKEGALVEAIAMSDRAYEYPTEVSAQVEMNSIPDYAAASEFINRKGFDVLSVQHEYGIFGGPAGKYLLDLVRNAKIPVVTTLHTILRDPNPEQREVMEELLELSSRVVVMSRTAVKLLSQIHGVDASKVDYIPHGIPKISAETGRSMRENIGGQGPILLTFGLLSPDKGIENVIQALPEIAREHPEVKYLVVGATHPHVKESSGEVYRQKLIQLAEDLGVTGHVEFVDEFVSLEKLTEYLSAADFYLTPYLNPRQITSGTLAYSLGAGNVVISTPYEYATEVLADGRGILVPFADPGAIAQAVIGSCAAPEAREKMVFEAVRYGSQMYWDRVGSLYFESFNRALAASKVMQRTERSQKDQQLPELSLDHLCALTDDTGLLQHATFSIPNRNEGYCVDDNARALMLTVNLESIRPLDPQVHRLQSRYFGFLLHAFDAESGKFRNFMSYQRNWLEQFGSEDSQGRSLWALGMTAGKSKNLHSSQLASKIFELAISELMSVRSPRALAYGILGAAAYLERHPETLPPRILLERFASKLFDAFIANETSNWPWLEERLAYANARIPQALLAAGHFLHRPTLIDKGTTSLLWLLENQVAREGCFSPIGTEGAGRNDIGKPQFDQQPIEAWSTVSACITAYKVTGKKQFLDSAGWCFDWFLGKNIHAIPVVNERTGSCFDGLVQDGVNLNQGAESTLAYLSSLVELKLATAPEVELIEKRGML